LLEPAGEPTQDIDIQPIQSENEKMRRPARAVREKTADAVTEKKSGRLQKRINHSCLSSEKKGMIGAANRHGCCKAGEGPYRNWSRGDTAE